MGTSISSSASLKLSDKAYNEIKRLIFDNVLVPNDPIYETTLAKELNMSRTPVREAIKKLELEGFLEIKTRGAYVKLPTIDELIMCQDAFEGLDGVLVYDLAMKNAKGQIEESFFMQLNEWLSEMDKACDMNDNYYWCECDLKFHYYLLTECDNIFIIEFMERLRTFYSSVNYSVLPLYIEKDKAIANQEHKDIVRYIKDSDAESARITAQKQHRRVRKHLEQHQEQHRNFQLRIK